MKCPYCLESFHEKWDYAYFSDYKREFLSEEEKSYGIRYCNCPACSKVIIMLGTIDNDVLEILNKTFETPLKRTTVPLKIYSFSNNFEWVLIKPRGISRTPLSKDVPQEYTTDYNESCLVLPYSPKASAALSRRCLQNLLIEKAGAKGKDLSQQIQYVLDSKELPSDLAEALDAIRNIGNFAAHPIKSKSSGEIIEVEPGEAEWNLDILEALFDFYFVRPAILAKKKEALNEKLKEAGKPLMKEG